MSDAVAVRAVPDGRKVELHPVDAKEWLRTGSAIEYTPFPWGLKSGAMQQPETDTALVVGTGPTARADLSLIDTSRVTLIAVNDAVWKIPAPWVHLMTWHAEFIESKFRRGFMERGFKNEDWPCVHVAESTMVSDVKGEPDCVWACGNPKGSSSLIAAGMALSMGFKQVVVAGCPLGPREKYKTFRQGWIDHKWMLEGKVLGVSGWIARNFGRYENGKA